MTLAITKTIKDIREHTRSWRANNLRIGLVATMGNLHEGHMDLFRTIAPSCDRVVCSIFTNPLQFGPNEDLAAYPRTWEEDVRKLEAVGAQALFAPSVSEMYGDQGMSETKVSVKRLNNRYCGASREGHFIGVATVVCKLFNIVAPHVAVFGAKDFQQLAVIRQMTSDLSMPVEILASPTYREPGGLAYSSRNQYLTPQERERAPLLYTVLCDLKDQIMAGATDWAALEKQGAGRLANGGFTPEYLSVADAITLDPANSKTQQLVILAAARLGKARLIDNVNFSR